LGEVSRDQSCHDGVISDPREPQRTDSQVNEQRSCHSRWEDRGTSCCARGRERQGTNRSQSVGRSGSRSAHHTRTGTIESNTNVYMRDVDAFPSCLLVCLTYPTLAAARTLRGEAEALRVSMDDFMERAIVMRGFRRGCEISLLGRDSSRHTGGTFFQSTQDRDQSC
jgi:hypothetical protein